MNTVKFNKYNVSCIETGKKARVHYSVDNRTDGRKCVTIYAKDYTNDLRDIIPVGYENNTDSMTDYFEKGRVVLFEDHPLYAIARERVTGEKVQPTTEPTDKPLSDKEQAQVESLVRLGDSRELATATVKHLRTGSIDTFYTKEANRKAYTD